MILNKFNIKNIFLMPSFTVLFLFLILLKDNKGNGMNQRVIDDVQELNYRGFNPLPKKDTLILSEMEKQIEPNPKDDSTKQELLEAKSRIDQLEKKIAILEGRVPQKYPEVKFLGYKERKRILVRLLFILTHRNNFSFILITMHIT